MDLQSGLNILNSNNIDGNVDNLNIVVHRIQTIENKEQRIVEVLKCYPDITYKNASDVETAISELLEADKNPQPAIVTDCPVKLFKRMIHWFLNPDSALYILSGSSKYTWYRGISNVPSNDIAIRFCNQLNFDSELYRIYNSVLSEGFKDNTIENVIREVISLNRGYGNFTQELAQYLICMMTLNSNPPTEERAKYYRFLTSSKLFTTFIPFSDDDNLHTDYNKAINGDSVAANELFGKIKEHTTLNNNALITLFKYTFGSIMFIKKPTSCFAPVKQLKSEDKDNQIMCYERHESIINAFNNGELQYPYMVGIAAMIDMPVDSPLVSQYNDILMAVNTTINIHAARDAEQLKAQLELLIEEYKKSLAFELVVNKKATVKSIKDVILDCFCKAKTNYHSHLTSGCCFSSDHANNAVKHILTPKLTILNREIMKIVHAL